MKPPTKRPVLWRCACSVWAALCLLVPGSTLAFDVIARSWTAASPDGRYLFVSIPPRMTLEQELIYTRDDETIRRTMKALAQRNDLKPEVVARITNSLSRAWVTQLRQRYPVSGLYRNDGSTNLLWAMPHNFLAAALIANDGKHLVAFDSDDPGVGRSVLAFYATGKLVRSYTLGDLVAFPFLLPTESGPSRPWCLSYALDDASGRLTVITKLRDRYVFDLATGRIVSSFRPSRLLAGLLVTVLIIVGALALRAVRRRNIRIAAQ
jgi:hypothetical protein